MVTGKGVTRIGSSNKVARSGLLIQPYYSLEGCMIMVEVCGFNKYVRNCCVGKHAFTVERGVIHGGKIT